MQLNLYEVTDLSCQILNLRTSKIRGALNLFFLSL